MTPEEMERAFKVAKEFHETYERLAPVYGYEQMLSWEDLPESDQQFLVGIFGDLLDKGVIYDREQSSNNHSSSE